MRLTTAEMELQHYVRRLKQSLESLENDIENIGIAVDRGQWSLMSSRVRMLINEATSIYESGVFITAINSAINDIVSDNEETICTD